MVAISRQDMTIEDLYASAWQNAISNVCKVLNRNLGTNYTLKDDWDKVENIALKLNIKFNEDGEIQ